MSSHLIHSKESPVPVFVLLGSLFLHLLLKNISSPTLTTPCRPLDIVYWQRENIFFKAYRDYYKEEEEEER
jgi:hypothetical protein